MSSRVLKKLQKDQDIVPDEQDQVSESDEMETNSWRNPNRFDFLVIFSDIENKILFI
jgi:hypothetical protein